VGQDVLSKKRFSFAKKMFRLLALLVLYISCSCSIVHASDSTSHFIQIKPTAEKIVIDGRLQEKTWLERKPITGFYNQFPKDSGFASLQTEVFLSYDDSNLYVAARCFIAAKPVIQAVNRDFNRTANESFYLILDAGDQKASGYLFGVTAGGAQVDGIITSEAISTEWDLKWHSAVNVDAGAYTLEMAIPLNILRLDHNVSRTGINFTRRDLFSNCYSSWYPVPATVNSYNLNYTGVIEWQQLLNKRK
jgi:hypothetical protein